MIVCGHLRLGYAMWAFGVLALVCLAIVVILIAEQVAQVLIAWMVKRRGRISLAGILLITTAAGVTFAFMRVSIWLTLMFLMMALVLVAGALERLRITKRDSSDNPLGKK